MTTLPVGTVAELWRYPVKSFRGERLDAVSLDARGVAGDRAYAVRDANGKLGSGKTTRRFRLLRGLFDYAAETRADGVVVRAPDGSVHRVGTPELDALLSARYGEELALLPEERVPHFDAGAVHVLTSSSLRWVGSGYGPEGAEACRYRPNVVLDTAGEDLVEEAWLGARLLVGSCVLAVSARVERCVMPTFRQGERPREPGLLRFLVERNETMLGVYADVVAPGTIRTGDAVTLAQPGGASSSSESK